MPNEMKLFGKRPGTTDIMGYITICIFSDWGILVGC